MSLLDDARKKQVIPGPAPRHSYVVMSARARDLLIEVADALWEFETSAPSGPAAKRAYDAAIAALESLHE